jgi:hypothetical protein
VHGNISVINGDWAMKATIFRSCAVIVGFMTAAAGPAKADEIVGAPIDLSAFVHEGLLPGPTIFEDTHSVFGAGSMPVESAEYFYPASRGENLSGRSTSIVGAFASSLAQSDGNGGVGVTSWVGPNPSSTNPAAVQQLVAQAIWQQDFTYNGTIPAPISLHLTIPALQVGLIGVPPQRDSFSNTETAEAEVTLAAIITHPDSTISPGTTFEFGLRAFEDQFVSGPQLFNVAAFQFIGINKNTIGLFDSFNQTGDDFNPRFNIDSVSTNVKIGTLEPGDTVSYVYKLTAEGTTNGGEQGFVAFLGDPSGADVISGNLIPTIGALPAAGVPEPSTWVLLIVGFGCVVGLYGRRTRPV